MRIVVDVMGSDKGPGEIIKGVIYALKEEIIKSAICIGNKELIRTKLDEFPKELTKKIDILHTDEEILMSEKPAIALKTKRHASIVEAIRLIKNDNKACVVSAGNTGAVVIAAVTILDKIKGILKPALATYIPTKKDFSILLDVGASVDCKPKHLYQFGFLGKIYAEHVLKKKNPRIGLLSIGEESIKGNKLTLDTYKLFVNSKLNFVGNVEGKDIMDGRVDIAVCDGFIGNVVLKFAEGLAESILSFLRNEISNSLTKRMGFFFLKPSFVKLKKVLDYAEYGGAPLLGINGYCIICHGKSNAKAIKNAIKQAKNLINSDLNYYIEEEIR